MLHSKVWKVVLSDTAVRQLKQIPKGKRAILKDGIRKPLVQSDPLGSTRNKFRLRRASPFAEYELRLDPWRVFYRVHGRTVEVLLIGEKSGNTLFIEGEKFIL